MYELPQRRISIGKPLGVPCQFPFCGSIWQRPPTVHGNVVVSERLEPKVYDGLRIRVDDTFVWGARVVVIGVPSTEELALLKEGGRQEDMPHGRCNSKAIIQSREYASIDR